MNQKPPETHMKFYGISPWEMEVAYGYFNPLFTVIQEEIESDNPDFVSVLKLEIPIQFRLEFFEWFDYKRWENVKSLFKEMKRRRGRGHALQIQVFFSGNPNIRFIIDSENKQWFDNAVEKIDFVLELLPYHLNPEKLPANVTEAIYRFDEGAKRWRLNTVFVGKRRFEFKDDGWKIT